LAWDNVSSRSGTYSGRCWGVIDYTQSTSGLGLWSECRAAEIEAAARANGEGFVPGCGDVIAILLEPILEPYGKHVTIALVPLPCVPRDETVWGEGTQFEGPNWGMYFAYTVQ
jgi:hypothetical protein